MPLIATAVPPPTWKRLRTSALLAFIFGAFEYAAAQLLSSFSAEADALHLFGDGAQSGLAASLAYLTAVRPHLRTASLSAYLQSLCLCVAGSYILLRLWTDDAHPHQAWLMLLLGLVATAVAIARLRIAHGDWELHGLAKNIADALARKRHLDLFATAEALHVLLDVVTSVFVLMTGALMLLGFDARIDEQFAYASSGVAFASAAVVFLLAKSGHHHDHGTCRHHH